MKKFILNNFLYIISLVIGLLFIINGKTIEIGVASRIMNSDIGLPVSVETQQLLGATIILYATYRIIKK